METLKVQVLNTGDPTVLDTAADPKARQDQALIQFIREYTDKWREAKDQDYTEKWRQYDRMWRGIWDGSDVQRQSERSKLVTPLLQAAVESAVADVHEAIFGPSGFFDVQPDEGTPPEVRLGLEQTKAELKRRFEADKVAADIDQVVQLSAVYGSGFAELTMDTTWDIVFVPSVDKDQVTRIKRFRNKPRPISPFNILAPSNIMDIADMPGIAVEEYISKQTVEMRVSNKGYRKFDVSQVGTQPIDPRLRPVQEENYTDASNWVHIIRWFGRVPAKMIGKPEEFDPTASPYDGEMVEAVVHILNGSTVALARANPYVSQRRPILHYPHDRVPGRFWGRGVCEKGLNMQLGADATFRAHLDSLAFTGMPVTVTDATKMPKGMRFELYPGRNMVINGPVQDAIQRLDLGRTDPALLGTTEVFERHLMQATGSMDSAALPSLARGGTDPLAMQMALAGAVKKAKRTMNLFTTEFLAAFIEEVVWRLYQFEGEKFRVKGGRFRPLSSLGILAREYENQRYTAMLATLGPESPLVPLLLAKIIRSSDMPDREALAAKLDEVAEQKIKDPAKAQADKLAAIIQSANLQEVSARVRKLLAEAMKITVEAKLAPMEVQAKMAGSLSQNMDENGDDFEKRLKLMDALIKERQVSATERQIDVDEKKHRENLALGFAQLTSNHATKRHELSIRDKEAEAKRTAVSMPSTTEGAEA